MGAAKHRRREHTIGFRHVARLGRPIYHRKRSLTIAEAIARERQQAAAEGRHKAKRPK